MNGDKFKAYTGLKRADKQSILKPVHPKNNDKNKFQLILDYTMECQKNGKNESKEEEIKNLKLSIVIGRCKS